MTRTAKALVALLLVPPWAVFMLCVYWFFFDAAPPAHFSEARTFNSKGDETREFRRGEVMVISRERCISDSGPVVFNRILLSKSKRVIYFLPSSNVIFRREGCSKAFNDITIPAFAEPGIYEYVVTVHYSNNPLVDGIIRLPAPEITVIE